METDSLQDGASSKECTPYINAESTTITNATTKHNTSLKEQDPPSLHPQESHQLAKLCLINLKKLKTLMEPQLKSHKKKLHE